MERDFFKENQKRRVIILKCTKCSWKQEAFHFFEMPRGLRTRDFLRGDDNNMPPLRIHWKNSAGEGDLHVGVGLVSVFFFKN